MDGLAGRPPRRRPWRIRLAILISLLIHVGIGILLLVTIRRQGTPDLLPPPSPVTMVFESGRKSGPTLPNPKLQATPSVPPTPAAPPTEAPPTSAPPPPPAAEPPSPPPPSPRTGRAASTAGRSVSAGATGPGFSTHTAGATG